MSHCLIIHRLSGFDRVGIRQISNIIGLVAENLGDPSNVRNIEHLLVDDMCSLRAPPPCAQNSTTVKTLTPHKIRFFSAGFLIEMKQLTFWIAVWA